MDSSDKKDLPVPILATKKSDPKAEDIYIVMIGADAYRAACHLKRAQIFAVLIRDIQYQAEKKIRAKAAPRSVVT